MIQRQLHSCAPRCPNTDALCAGTGVGGLCADRVGATCSCILRGSASLQVQATTALLRALQHIPSLRGVWGLHNSEPFQALVQSREPDVRWLAIECLALLAKLVCCVSLLLAARRLRHAKGLFACIMIMYT